MPSGPERTVTGLGAGLVIGGAAVALSGWESAYGSDGAGSVSAVADDEIANASNASLVRITVSFVGAWIETLDEGLP
jgi:hypothetical protein